MDSPVGSCDSLLYKQSGFGIGHLFMDESISVQHCVGKFLVPIGQ